MPNEIARLAVPYAAVAFAACAPAVAPVPATENTQVAVTLLMPAAAAVARVQAAFAADGLALESAGGSIVSGAYTANTFVRVTISGAILPTDSASSRVILTGRLNTPQAGRMVPAETIQVSASNRRQGKVGAAAWLRMQRIAAALSAK
jgi:hypothetical protein